MSVLFRIAGAFAMLKLLDRRSLRVSIGVCFLGCVLLSGCKTSNPIPKDFYSNGVEDRLPPISVFGKKPSDELAAICAKAKCIQGPELISGIYDEFVKSKMFEAMAGGENKSDYQLQIAARRVDPGDAKEFAKIMTSAASLLVVPVVITHEYRSEFVVKWRGIDIASYNFDIPYDETIFLLKNFEQSKQFAAEALAAKFLSAVQGDGVFTSDFLYAALKAENYRRDLKAPNQVGDYARTDMFIYPDPFLGVQLRYQHGKQRDEKDDVFVYPVRQADWSDLNKTLMDEMEAVLKDVDLAVKAGAYKSAQFDSAKAITLGKNRLAGRSAVGYVVASSGEQLRSFIYLFVVKDKIVKFRITSINADSAITQAETEAFIGELLSQLSVPDESFFIATLRQNRRNSTIQ